ncbi:MAG: AAA family ATPase [Treponema sp.]
MQMVTPMYQDGELTTRNRKQIDMLLLRFLPDRFQVVDGFCKKHGKYNAFIDTDTGEISPCPECEKELEQTAERQKKERKRLQKLLERIDGLPEKYKSAGFKNFEQNEKNRVVFNRVLAFAKEPKNTWLLLLGENGTGKTHLAHAVLKMTGGIYREFGEMATELLDAQNGYSIGQKAAINKYGYAPLLVIDEIDKVKDTEGRVVWLNDILRKRYNELLPVIIVGNIDLEMKQQKTT